MDNSFSYYEYFTEKIDKSISYTEYVADQINNSMSYSDYLAEKLSPEWTRKMAREKLKKERIKKLEHLKKIEDGWRKS